MQFKKRSIYKLISLFFATIFSLLLAYNGSGVWSIVALYVLTSLFLTIIYFFFEKRITLLSFDKKAFKKMYSFGANITIASILNSAFDNIYQLLLGRYFSINQAGFFYQAKRLQEVSDTLFKIVTFNAVYSHLSKMQDDKKIFIQNYLKIAIFSAVIAGFSTSIVVLYAEQIIIIFYGEKWRNSIFFLQFCSISSFFYLQEIVNSNIFKVYDLTSFLLRIEIIKKLIQIPTIVIGIYFMRIEYLLYGYVFTSICSYFITNYISSREIEIKSYPEVKAVLTILLVSSLGVSFVFFLKLYLSINNLYLLPFFFKYYFFVMKKFGLFDLYSEIKLIFAKKIAFSKLD